MTRIKIEMPDKFSFVTYMPIRITDLNYGGHVGNDMILSIIHESRVQFLLHHGYRELDLEGAGLIMSDVAITFKNEIFYGDKIKASVAAAGFSKIGFDIFYKLEKETAEKNVLVVQAKTGMICYDYKAKRIAHVPDKVRSALQG